MQQGRRYERSQLQRQKYTQAKFALVTTQWARKCLDRRKAAKQKVEVAATLDRMLSQLPREEADALAREMMAHIAASFRAPASGSMAETPQVIYFAILFIDAPDRTNARPARQVDPVPGRDEQEDCLDPQVGPHPVPPCFNYPYRFVSSVQKNSKGDEILFPVNDDRDRQWAKRLDWVVERHLDRAEDELEEPCRLHRHPASILECERVAVR